jgi:hypothetical protein
MDRGNHGTLISRPPLGLSTRLFGSTKGFYTDSLELDHRL